MAKEDESGDISQADLDAMLAGAGGGAAEPESGDSGGGLNQADIDATMGGGGDSSDSGEMSQADIDAAMGGGGGDSSDSSEMSQADIDAAMGGGSQAAASSRGGSQAAADEVLAGARDTDVLDQSAIDKALEAAGDAVGEVVAAVEEQDARLDSAGRPFDDIAAAMAEAIGGDASDVGDDAPPLTSASTAAAVQALDVPDFHNADLTAEAKKKIDLLEDVELNVRIELGRTRMLVEDVLGLNDGAIVELEKLAGDPVDVLVNERLVARGEVLVLNDNFCVRINEIISHRGEALRS